MSNEFPRLGALLLTLPSILAFVMACQKDRDPRAITSLAREAVVLVPLGLPFFVPMAFSGRFGLSILQAFAASVILTVLAIRIWFRPQPELR